MMNRILFLCAALFAIGAVTPAVVHAQSAGEIRQRMAQRLAQIDELKAKGALGENNRGFLEVREAQGNAASLAADENRDRETVYALIARETGSSADAVGRARARQIAAQSRPGVWVQEDSGAWVRIPDRAREVVVSQIKVGMSKSEVRARLGSPSSTSETTMQNATVEYWHYKTGASEVMIRFDDGRVSSITLNR